MAKYNAVVGQSGGPTAVINSSVLGVINGCRQYLGDVGAVYGMHHGIEGLLGEELVNLTAQPEVELRLLRTTPAAGSIGTCRYKLQSKDKTIFEEDYRRIVEVLRAHDIKYFFYTGGNDSMDTANRVSQFAKDMGYELIAVGVPKTIDNDVGGLLIPDTTTFSVIDHTPGYGSVARFGAHRLQEANEENAGSCTDDPVLVMQAMGRKIGFIPAAYRLGDPDRKIPLQIYLAESGATLPQIRENVNEQLGRDGRVIVVVSEGCEFGGKDAVSDAFGHTKLSTGTPAAETLTFYLNSNGISARGAARFEVYGTSQRNTIMHASARDLHEAYHAGLHAVRIARESGTGWMSTIVRSPSDVYSVRYDKVPLADVAGSERKFPEEWIAKGGSDVTDDFLAYAAPLIETRKLQTVDVRGWGDNDITKFLELNDEGALAIPMDGDRYRFAQLDVSKRAEKKLEEYMPQGHRPKS